MLLLLVITGTSGEAQDVYDLWEGNNMPFYKESDVVEIEKPLWGTTAVLKVVKPTLTVYNAKGNNTGKGVIVIPGGGYEAVAMYHEGYEVAKELAARGITAAVLKYRIPNPATSTEPNKVPLADVRRAMVMLREMAEKYDFDPEKLGLVGFSAGSHLATVASLWKSEIENENPNYSGLIYGVTNITGGNLNWIENNLFFRKLTADEIKENTLLELVDENTPPAFLAHAIDDTSCKVEETTLYATKLRENNVMVETHIFSKGGHGFGVGSPENGTDQWIDLFVNWVRVNNL